MTEQFWPRILGRLNAGESLGAEETAQAMRTIMQGEATAAQMGGFLMALRHFLQTVADGIEMGPGLFGVPGADLEDPIGL